MYEQFLADPSSVDPAWHDFFADYKRAGGNGTAATTAGGGTTTTTVTPPAADNSKAPAAPKQQPKPAATLPSTGKPAPQQAAKAAPVTPSAQPEQKQLRGAAAAIAKNMELSLTVPTATSVRAVPAKLLADNRIVINNHLKRTRGGKVSFTHVIGYA